MDLFTSSGSSVTAAAVGKAVGTWVAPEAIWGGQQRPICCFDGHRWTRWPKLGAPTVTIALAGGVVGEGAQGFWSGARWGGEKVSAMLVSIGMVG